MFETVFIVNSVLLLEQNPSSEAISYLGKQEVLRF
jgi:hypothetical protein